MVEPQFDPKFLQFVTFAAGCLLGFCVGGLVGFTSEIESRKPAIRKEAEYIHFEKQITQMDRDALWKLIYDNTDNRKANAALEELKRRGEPFKVES